MLGKIEGNRKRGPSMSCTDSIKEAMGLSLRMLGRAAGDRTLHHHPFSTSPAVRADFVICNNKQLSGGERMTVCSHRNVEEKMGTCGPGPACWRTQSCRPPCSALCQRGWPCGLRSQALLASARWLVLVNGWCLQEIGGQQGTRSPAGYFPFSVSASAASPVPVPSSWSGCHLVTPGPEL